MSNRRRLIIMCSTLALVLCVSCSVILTYSAIVNYKQNLRYSHIESERLEQEAKHEITRMGGSIVKLLRREQLDVKFSGPNIDDESFSRIACHLKHLRLLAYLDLSNTSISDESVDLLAQFSDLYQLNVRNTNLSEEGYEILQDKLPETAVLFNDEIPRVYRR